MITEVYTLAAEDIQTDILEENETEITYAESIEMIADSYVMDEDGILVEKVYSSELTASAHAISTQYSNTGCYDSN